MMNIYIYNGFKLKDICSQYTSLKFSRYFRGIGNFELVLNNLQEAKKFEIGNYIVLDKDAYIVQSIHKYKQADKTMTIEVRGKHINTILEQRVAEYLGVYESESYEITCEELVRDNFISATDTDRNIDIMEIEVSTVATYSTTDFLINSMDIASMLNIVLSKQQLGYKLLFDTDKNKIIFKVLQPLDKREAVFFSEIMGNVAECDFYIDNSNEKNICYVFADNYTSIEGNAVGLERKEMCVTSSTGAELSNSTSVESASVAVLNTSSYTYKVDYDVGTIVTFFDNDLNIKTTKQINCITEYHSAIDEIEITIGDFVPTVYDKLKMKGGN